MQWELGLYNYVLGPISQRGKTKYKYRQAVTYPKKSSTSATWSAKSSTLSNGTSEEITSAPNCKNS